MRKSLLRPAGRGGFTLVELMIVIAIIGLLVAILVVALGPLISKGGEITTRNDINQLGISLQAFKDQFGFYPPSLFWLCENQNDYGTSPAMQDSKYYLLKMFPRLASNPYWTTAGLYVDWNMDGKYTPPVVLTGDQCLVFFLGGIEPVNITPRTCVGFPTNPAVTNPTDPVLANRPLPLVGNNVTTYGPYFEFKSERLVLNAQDPTGKMGSNPNGYLSYLDGYKQRPPAMPVGARPGDEFFSVYAYFSSGRTRNNYNRYGASDCPYLVACIVDPTTHAGTPATALFPYALSAGNYHNPNTYQIISPGKDGMFGLGSPPPGVVLQGGYFWTSAPNTPSSPDKVPGVPTTAGLGDGRDDITNFNATLLGKQ